MPITLNGNLLELCVLAVVYSEDQYGYRLTRQMKEKFDLSESSLYPVLRRLTHSGLLKTYDLPHDGRMRRYYSLTQEGRETYQKLCLEWNSFSESIDEMLRKNGESNKGENDHDQS